MSDYVYSEIYLPESNSNFLRKFKQIIEEFSYISLAYNANITPGQRTEYFLATKGSWESRRLDLCILSAIYLKGVLMHVDCYGKKPGEIWREYYLGGQIFTAEAKIVFPNLSEVQQQVKDKE